VPGIGADHSSWFRQLSAFQKYHRVIIFDPRSIGKSSRPKEPYAFRALADDVAGLMDHLGIGKAHILGQSLGGIVAQEIAIDYPDRVLKLVLVSTLAGGDAEGVNPALTGTFGPAEGAADAGFSGMDTRKTMNTLITMTFNKWPYRKAMQIMSRLFVKPAMFDGLSDQVGASAGHTTLDRLHLIQAPTLVITGAGDRIIRPQSSERLAARIPNARLVTVKGGSHGFNLEMAARFNREVLDFLRAGQASHIDPDSRRETKQEGRKG
jgi:pimeloyl-ACP methyl ester carboxylesterase